MQKYPALSRMLLPTMTSEKALDAFYCLSGMCFPLGSLSALLYRCVYMCARVCARMCMPGFPVPIPPSLVSWACPTVQAPFPGLFREIPTRWLPAFYVLMVAFSLVAGMGLLAASSLAPPAFPSRVCFFAGVAFLPLFYFILFFLLTETRARPSSPLQDLLRTSRYRFTAARVLVIAQLLRVLINPAALGAS